MRDDALAPVVAMMLILAVVVTLFSLWTSVYLPGLKQQAEVEHLSQVEGAMERIDSAIGDAIYYKRSGSLSVPVPLGGGDITLNSAKSGGVLRVGEEPVMILTLFDSGGTPTTYPVTISNVTYTPVSNFWIPQGYSWQFGALNVTKGDITTSLGFKDDTNSEIEQFAQSLFCTTTADCSITYINIKSGTRNATSGNGIANLKLNATWTALPTISDVSQITVEIVPDLPDSFKDSIREKVNQSLDELPGSSPHDPPPSEQSNITYLFTSNSDVAINRLDLILSVE